MITVFYYKGDASPNYVCIGRPDGYLCITLHLKYPTCSFLIIMGFESVNHNDGRCIKLLMHFFAASLQVSTINPIINANSPFCGFSTLFSKKNDLKLAARSRLHFYFGKIYTPGLKINLTDLNSTFWL